jgi:hypothetical protein
MSCTMYTTDGHYVWAVYLHLLLQCGRVRDQPELPLACTPSRSSMPAYIRGTAHEQLMHSVISADACPLLLARFVFCLLFDPKDGGYILLRNVSRLSTGYTALYPRRYNSVRTTDPTKLLWPAILMSVFQNCVKLLHEWVGSAISHGTQKSQVWNETWNILNW